MAVDTITKSKTKLVQEYFKRQYETEEGTAGENVRALFAEDLLYHLADDRTMSLEELIRAADRIRRSSRTARRVAISGLREEGDRVYFHMDLGMLDPETGQRVELASDHEWRFDDTGKVVEVWPADLTAVSRAFEAMDIDAR